MMRRKVFCLTLCLTLLLATLSLAVGEADGSGQTRRLRLGSSIYTIEIDASYTYGEVTEEDAAGDQVAYLYSDRLAVDFDVYQRGIAGEGMTLAEYVATEAEVHSDVDEVVADGEINGIPVGWYHAVETWNDAEYRTATYVLEDGEDFVEIVFWMDGENAEAAVQAMISSLACDNLVPVRLGSSPYWVFCSDSFREGGMTGEDLADGQVAYWVSEETRLDFDVYQFSKEGLPERLADYVVEEASSYDDVSRIVLQTEVNGIPMGWYRAREEYDGVVYDTLTCVLDAGAEYVEIVFWLDGLTAGAEADAILQSLWMEQADQAGAEADEEAEIPAGEAGEDEAVGAPAEANGYVEAETAATEELVDTMLEAMEEPVGAIPEESGAAPEADAIEGAFKTDVLEDILEAEATEEGLGAQAGEDALEVGTGEDALEVEAAEEGLGAQTGGDAEEADAMMAALEAEAAAARAEEMEEAEAYGEAPLTPEGGAATKLLRLGTTPFTMSVPVGFTEGEVTQEEIEDDQVAYYYSKETLLDFDIYQFGKDGYPDDLAVYAEEEAAGYNAVSELVTDGEINGIPVAWYRTVEVYQDEEFDTITYILDAGSEYAEVVFWLDGETADAEAMAIIRTLSRDDGTWEDVVVLTGAGEETAGPEQTGEAAPLEDAGGEPAEYGARGEPSDDGPDAVGEEAVKAAE